MNMYICMHAVLTHIATHTYTHANTCTYTVTHHTYTTRTHMHSHTPYIHTITSHTTHIQPDLHLTEYGYCVGVAPLQTLLPCDPVNKQIVHDANAYTVYAAMHTSSHIINAHLLHAYNVF